MATVKEIRAELTERGIEIPKGARKADLEALLEESTGDAAPAPSGRTIPPGSIDPALVAQRDAAREREAPARVGRVRPTPASIDPRLVEIRRQVRKDEEANAARPATSPPAR